MRTLTLRQPWATLVAIGAKKIETRGWKTSYRGPLAIHAAKGFPKAAQELCKTFPFCTALLEAGYWKASELPTGGILAVCDLVNIYSTDSRVTEIIALDFSFDSEQGVTGGTASSFFLPPNYPEVSFGDYSPGRFAWRLENVQALPEPVPARGYQSLWNWQP